MTPNLLLRASRDNPDAEAGFVDCNHALQNVDSDRFTAVFFQDGLANGALELALPWELLGDFVPTGSSVLLPVAGMNLRVLAAVTSGLGGGVVSAGRLPSRSKT